MARKVEVVHVQARTAVVHRMPIHGVGRFDGQTAEIVLEQFGMDMQRRQNFHVSGVPGPYGAPSTGFGEHVKVGGIELSAAVKPFSIVAVIHDTNRHT